MVIFDCTVLVFSKAPVPATVKTRLLPAVNEDEAAYIYKELVDRTLATVTARAGWATRLWCTPVADHPYFLECREKYGVELRQQRGGDLGARMHAAIVDTLEESESILLVGCDCPELQLEDLETANTKLRAGYEVILGPCEDGGYYLIGMNESHPELFTGIDWGTATVLDDTRQRLQKLRLEYFELPLRWDLDDAADLERYLVENVKSEE